MSACCNSPTLRLTYDGFRVWALGFRVTLYSSLNASTLHPEPRHQDVKGNVMEDRLVRRLTFSL